MKRITVRSRATAELLIDLLRREGAPPATCEVQEIWYHQPAREKQVTRKQWVFTIGEAT